MFAHAPIIAMDMPLRASMTGLITREMARSCYCTRMQTPTTI